MRFVVLMVLMCSLTYAQFKFPGWTCKDAGLLIAQKELAPDNGYRAQLTMLEDLAARQTVTFADIVAAANMGAVMYSMHETFVPNCVKAYVVINRMTALLPELKQYVVANPTAYDCELAMSASIKDPTWSYAVISARLTEYDYQPAMIQRSIGWLVRYTPQVATDEQMKTILVQLNNQYTAKLGEDKDKWADTVAAIRTVLLNYTK